MNILYIALKHVIWRFWICIYFREICKVRDFMNTLRNFAKFLFAHIFTMFKYLAEKININRISRSRALKMIHNMSIFEKFESFSDTHFGDIGEQFHENCS